MNKYDTEIIMSKKSSLTYMISQIKPGTRVLEFGPATGYMTRYLQEEKTCKVSIIEIDDDAFRIASSYAEDGICCDAEQMEWVDKFQGQKFDYITFADVLEHLKYPENVLKRCTDFLEENGRVLVSVPNIAHNAVLVDLYNNKFQYRKTGILDNTHLRFYTHDSIRELFHNCGLAVANEDAIVFNMDYVGFDNSEKDVPEDFWKELRVREYGFVNQFLFALEPKMKDEIDEDNEAGFRDVRLMETVLYYVNSENSNEFSEKQKIISQLHWENGSFYADFELSNVAADKLLIVPIERICIIENMKIVSETESMEAVPVGGFPVQDGNIGFICDYPKYIVTFKPNERINAVRISGRIRNIEQGELKQYIHDILAEEKKTITFLENEVVRLNQVIEEKLDIIYNEGMEIGRLNEVIEEKQRIIHEMSM